MSCRVLFANRSYWPDTEATGQLLTELCEDLARTGEFEIHVLCGFPNHVSGNGSGPLPEREVRNGVTIHRAPHTQFSKRSIVGKLTNLTSFTLSAWWRSRKLPRPDVVITETDPFFLGLLGRRLQSRLGCRFVAYLQDIYPDIAVAVGKASEGVLVRRWRAALFGAYRKADRVVVLSDDMKKRCIEHGVSPDRLVIIPNWADTENIRPVIGENQFRTAQGLGDKLVVMYSGNQGLPHLLTPILGAAEQLRDRSDIEFLFVGEGVQRKNLEQAARDRGLSNVRFLSYQPKEFLSHSLGAGDIQIVSVKPDVISCLMPSKLYGILAAGSSVLAIAPSDCEMSRLVREQDVGEVCDLASGERLGSEIAAAILRMMDPNRRREIAGRARALAEREFTRPLQVERFRTLLQSLAGGTGDRADLTNESRRCEAVAT